MRDMKTATKAGRLSHLSSDNKVVGEVGLEPTKA